MEQNDAVREITTALEASKARLRRKVIRVDIIGVEEVTQCHCDQTAWKFVESSKYPDSLAKNHDRNDDLVCGFQRFGGDVSLTGVVPEEIPYQDVRIDRDPHG
jgi:hypothetical protein